MPCPECKSEKVAQMPREYVQEDDGNLYLKKMKARCLACGFVWEITLK